MNNTNLERRILLREYFDCFHPEVDSELNVEELKTFIREYENTKTKNSFPFMTLFEDLSKVVADGVAQGLLRTEGTNKPKIYIAKTLEYEAETYLHPIYKSRKKSPVKKAKAKTTTTPGKSKKLLTTGDAGDDKNDITEGTVHENSEESKAKEE